MIISAAGQIGTELTIALRRAWHCGCGYGAVPRNGLDKLLAPDFAPGTFGVVFEVRISLGEMQDYRLFTLLGTVIIAVVDDGFSQALAGPR